MKKIFAILAIIAVSAFCSMNANAETRLGSVTGITVSDLHFNQQLVSVNKHMGFNVGVIGEMMVPGIGFGLDAQLLYSYKGAGVGLNEKYVWQTLGVTTRQNVTLHQIEIPLNVKYRYMFLQGLENTIAPLVYGGPSFSFCAGGSSTDNFKHAGVSMGVHVGVGAELFRKMQVTFERNWSITENTRTHMLDEFAAKHQTWEIKFIYYFLR